MKDDMKRLCEAADATFEKSWDGDAYMGGSDVTKAVVRAILTELRNSSEEMERAALDAGGMTDDGQDKRASISVEFAAMIDHVLAE